MYSPAIDNLIRALKKLPSVGQRTAERFAFHWLGAGKKEVNELRDVLNTLLEKTKSCEICWNFDDTSPCHTCQNPRRDQTQVCVVESPEDIPVIEKTAAFSGTYHVLRGTLNADLSEIEIQKLKIPELLKRASPTAKLPVQEIILALNLNLAGETTMLFLEQELKKTNPQLKVSRLARGLPLGSDVRYADEMTLGSAIRNRK